MGSCRMRSQQPRLRVKVRSKDTGYPAPHYRTVNNIRLPFGVKGFIHKLVCFHGNGCNSPFFLLYLIMNTKCPCGQCENCLCHKPERKFPYFEGAENLTEALRVKDGESIFEFVFVSGGFCLNHTLKTDYKQTVTLPANFVSMI